MAEFTKQEIEQELARRAAAKQQEQSESFDPQMAAKALAAGTGSMGITADEKDFPGYERWFRAGAGGGAGAVGGFAVGGPVGGVIGATTGAMGNVAAKELFPESPVSQALLQLLLPGSQAGLGFRTTNVPSAKPMQVNRETGIPLTGGQATGDVETLMEESRVARSVRGSPIADAFKVAQAQSVDDFFSNLQKFEANPNLSPQEVSQGIYKAFQDFTTKEYNLFKANNTKSFSDAAKAAGNAKVIPADATTARIDQLIGQYKNLDPNTVPEAPNIVASLESLKKQFAGTTVKTPLMTVEKTAPGFSVSEFQKIAEDFGAQAYGKSKAPGTGSAVFAGVAPGTSSGMIKYILGGMREDLSTAAQSGAKGAKELDAARKGFAAGLDRLEEVAAKPLIKYFNKPNASALVPEEVVAKMAELKPSQKAELAFVIKEVRPDIYETIRAEGLRTVLSEARIGQAAAAGSPKFDIGFALKKLGKLDDAEVAWLFPTKEEKNLFKAGLQNLQQIQKKADVFDPDTAETAQKLRALEQSAGALKGPIAKYGTQAIVSIFRSLVGTADEQKLAAIMFNPDGRSLIRELSKDKPNINAIEKAFKPISASLLASSALSQEVESPAQRAAKQQQLNASLEAVQEEARRRGLIK